MRYTMATEASALASVAVTAANVRGPNPEPPHIRWQHQPKQSGLTKRRDCLGREPSRFIVLPCGWRQRVTGDLPGLRKGRFMKHDFT